MHKIRVRLSEGPSICQSKRILAIYCLKLIFSEDENISLPFPHSLKTPDIFSKNKEILPPKEGIKFRTRGGSEVLATGQVS